jgi:PIN domain nuclease of toxin-antitoxin system
VTVLDAYAVIAFLLNEPAKIEVERLLRAQEPVPRLATVNVAEVVDQLVRVRGHTFDDVIERLTWLAVGGLEIVDIGLESGALAGLVRASHYNRRDNDVSMADCFALATALVLEDSIATSDSALATSARAEGVAVVALPDSKGRRPD